MFLNTIKACDGLTNEITNILAELSGGCVIMDSDYNLLDRTGIIGKVEMSNGCVVAIVLEGKYRDFFEDVSFMLNATEIRFCNNCENAKEESVPSEILQEYLVLTEEEYKRLATQGDLIRILQLNGTHGVVIRQSGLIKVQYDYCYQDHQVNNKVFVNNGLVQLTPVNSKPTTRYVNKFTMDGSEAFLCVFDLSYVSNVGVIFAPVNAKSLQVSFFNQKGRLDNMNLF